MESFDLVIVGAGKSGKCATFSYILMSGRYSRPSDAENISRCESECFNSCIGKESLDRRGMGA